jgi:cation transport regulator
MPYNDTSELPESVRNVLPDHAQDIFKEAFNSAYEEYGGGDQEETAFRVAWAAVKQKYEKGADDKWHPKDE